MNIPLKHVDTIEIQKSKPNSQMLWYIQFWLKKHINRLMKLFTNHLPFTKWPGKGVLISPTFVFTWLASPRISGGVGGWDHHPSHHHAARCWCANPVRKNVASTLEINWACLIVMSKSSCHLGLSLWVQGGASQLRVLIYVTFCNPVQL